MVSTDTEIELQRIPASEAIAELAVPDEGPALMPQADETVLLSLRTTGLGRVSLLSLWLEPGGRALQRLASEVGKLYRYGSYRFAQDGIYRQRRYPARQDEYELPPDEWTQGSDSYQEYPAACSNPCPVSDPAALFYVLATSPIQKPGDSTEFLFYTSGGLVTVAVAAQKSDRIRVNYVQESGHMEQHVKGSVDVLRLSVRGKPFGGNDDADFRLLGLQDNIVLYFLPGQRLLVRIEGRAPKVGKVTIKLQRAIFD